MYNEMMVQPMREELTSLGVKELRTAAEVDQALKRPGTVFVMVNSVCGCAAGAARPAVAVAVKHATLPDALTTVFAGQDQEAVAQARSYFKGYQPSSPSMALLKDGQLVWMLERRQIEGRPAPDIARDIAGAFDKYCSKA